jgi:hypothetical protein
VIAGRTYIRCVPPPDPLTRLRQIATDLERLAVQLEADTGLDPTVFRYWRAQLLEIAGELEAKGARRP